MLHGVTVDQLLTIAIMGLASASASNPAAWSIARAGARAGPSTISRDGQLCGGMRNSCVFRDTFACEPAGKPALRQKECVQKDDFSLLPNQVQEYERLTR